jgi:hypothetical protein
MAAQAINEEVVVLNFPQVQQVTGSVEVTGLTFSGSIDATPTPAPSHVTTNFAASLSSQVAMGSNPNRRAANFFNVPTSKGICYLAIGTQASTGAYMVALRPGSFYSFDVVPSEPISFVFDNVPGNVMVTEQS